MVNARRSRLRAFRTGGHDAATGRSSRNGLPDRCIRADFGYVRDHAVLQSPPRAPNWPLYRVGAYIPASGVRVCPERLVRMISFSVSTTRKNTRPPSKSQGQTQSGTASVSKRTCIGGAYVNKSCRMMTAPMPIGRYLFPRCAFRESDE